jgi:hypothetical protein
LFQDRTASAPTRQAAARALGSLGTAAREAIPALEAALGEGDVQGAAKAALEKIRWPADRRVYLFLGLNAGAKDAVEFLAKGRRLALTSIQHNKRDRRQMTDSSATFQEASPKGSYCYADAVKASDHQLSQIFFIYVFGNFPKGTVFTDLVFKGKFDADLSGVGRTIAYCYSARVKK